MVCKEHWLPNFYTTRTELDKMRKCFPESQIGKACQHLSKVILKDLALTQAVLQPSSILTCLSAASQRKSPTCLQNLVMGREMNVFFHIIN